MLVRNKTDRELTVNKSFGCIVLKPATVTFIEDGKITEKELTDIYGSRIAVIKDEASVSAFEVKTQTTPKQIELKERTEDITDKSLDAILKSVKAELEIAKKEEAQQVQDVPQVLADGTPEADKAKKEDSPIVDATDKVKIKKVNSVKLSSKRGRKKQN